MSRPLDHAGDDPAMLPDDIDELRQIPDDDYKPVRVRVEGPILGHELPARTAFSRSVNVSNGTDPVALEQVAAGDPRIKYLTIIVGTNPAYVGHDKQGVSDGICGILPVGVPLTLPTSAPIWVRSTVAGGSVVSYWSGNWAD